MRARTGWAVQALAVAVCAALLQRAAAASFPLPEPSWTTVADPLELDTPRQGVAVVGYRNLYPLPQLDETEFLSSIEVRVTSFGQADTTACISLVAVQTNEFDPFAVGEDGVCAPGHLGNYTLENPLNDVPYYAVVEAALAPSVQFPSLRYTQCLTNAECATMYNVTVSYVVCDGQSFGPMCNDRLTTLVLDEVTTVADNSSRVLAAAVEDGNSTLTLSYDVVALPDALQLCIAAQFGSPPAASGDPGDGGVCVEEAGPGKLSAVLPGVGRFFWSVYLRDSGDDGAAADFSLNVTASVAKCTAAQCIAPGQSISGPVNSTAVPVSADAPAMFTYTPPDPTYSVAVTAADASPAETEYALAAVPFAFQNVPAARLSVPSTARDTATGVRAIVVDPAPELWLLSLTCSSCANATVSLSLTSDACPGDCSGKGECKDSVCDCDDGYGGLDCQKLRPLTVGETETRAVPAADWVFWLVETPATVETMTVAVTDPKQLLPLAVRRSVAPTLTEFDAATLGSTLEWPAAGGEKWVVGVYNAHYGIINPTLNVTVIASASLTPAASVPYTETPQTPLDALKGADTRIKLFNWTDILLSLVVLAIAVVLVFLWARRARTDMQNVEEDDDDYLRVYERGFEEDRASRAQDVVFH